MALQCQISRMSTTFSYLLKVDRVSFGEGERGRAIARTNYTKRLPREKHQLLRGLFETRARSCIRRATRSGTDRFNQAPFARTLSAQTRQPPTRNSSPPFVCSPFSQIFSLCALGLRSCSVTLSRGTRLESFKDIPRSKRIHRPRLSRTIVSDRGGKDG